MKLWHKIALGLGVLVVFVANQGNRPVSVPAVSSPISTPQVVDLKPEADILSSSQKAPTLEQIQPTEETKASNIPSPEIQNTAEPQKVISPPPSEPEPSLPIQTYTNSAGNEVPSPTFTKSQPEGATAQCRDGSYSFSQSRRGTCSHHGGVAEWF